MLIGFGKKIKFNKEIIDLRTEKFDENLEKRWIEEYQLADCAIGVHGSNITWPSLLVKHMINLIPEYKYFHALEDMRYDAEASLAENFHRYQVL